MADAARKSPMRCRTDKDAGTDWTQTHTQIRCDSDTQLVSIDDAFAPVDDACQNETRKQQAGRRQERSRQAGGRLGVPATSSNRSQ